MGLGCRSVAFSLFVLSYIHTLSWAIPCKRSYQVCQNLILEYNGQDDATCKSWRSGSISSDGDGVILIMKTFTSTHYLPGQYVGVSGQLQDPPAFRPEIKFGTHWHWVCMSHRACLNVSQGVKYLKFVDYSLKLFHRHLVVNVDFLITFPYNVYVQGWW